MIIVQATALLHPQTYMRAGLLGSQVVTRPPVRCGVKNGHQLSMLMGRWRALQDVPVAVWGACKRAA